MKFFNKEIDRNKYMVVKYFLAAPEGHTIRESAWALAIGQSVGNPNIRSQWETDELFENHSCVIVGDEEDLFVREGYVDIAFPIINIDFNTDGISHLLVNIMGGQLDIDIVSKCHVISIDFPKEVEDCFLGPKYGIKGIREFTKSFDKPILGGIIKPKTGITPQVLLEMVKELVEGGVDFIKEDEILSDPYFCSIEERVPLIMDYLKDKNVIYAVSIHSDIPYLIDRVKQVYRLGGNAVHVNFWCGLGIYNAIRKLDLPMFLFFQKSGDKILTNESHDYHIKWDVICKIAAMSGVDFIHAGMWGGYLSDNEKDLKETFNVLYQYGTLPSLSCGMQPGLVQAINKRFGFDYMANVGGAIHGHPSGTKAGTLAMRQAIDKTGGIEYIQAIDKWKLID